MTEIRKYLWLSQILLFALLGTCCLIVPNVVVSNGGVSNFGNHFSTFGLYSLAFLSNIFFIYLVAKRILKKFQNFHKVAYVLLSYCLLESLVLISTFPRHFSWTFSYIHDYLGVALFYIELGLTIWFVSKRKTALTALFLVIELIGQVIGLFSILKTVQLLLVGQLLASFGFGLFLVIIFPDILRTEALVKNKKRQGQ